MLVDTERGVTPASRGGSSANLARVGADRAPADPEPTCGRRHARLAECALRTARLDAPPESRGSPHPHRDPGAGASARSCTRRPRSSVPTLHPGHPIAAPASNIEHDHLNTMLGSGHMELVHSKHGTDRRAGNTPGNKVRHIEIFRRGSAGASILEKLLTLRPTRETPPPHSVAKRPNRTPVASTAEVTRSARPEIHGKCSGNIGSVSRAETQRLSQPSEPRRRVCSGLLKEKHMEQKLDLVSVEELSIEDLPNSVSPGFSSAATASCFSCATGSLGTYSSLSSYTA